MSQFSSLTVIVPRLLERLRSASTPAPSVNDSLLAQLAGRGDIARRWRATQTQQARLLPWQRGLLATLRLDEARYASGPVCAVGQDSEHDGVDWLHAEPIHLAAGLNEVTLVPLEPDFRLTAHERDALTSVLAVHVAADGWVLRPAATNAWLLGATHALEVTTVAPEFAQRNDWAITLPQGPGAPRVRRLMTEIQMLLHEHPVNEARARRGLPIVNSLWLWGSGSVARTAMPAVQACAGQNDYLRGLCRLNGWPAPLEAESAVSVLELANASTATLCVLAELRVADFERDWLAPFVAALRSGQLEQLELVVDEWLITIDRWRLRRFWRKNLSFQTWAAA
jgi:hypothetical protein